MKNALNYYYNLDPSSIHQINRNYRCHVHGEEYLLTLCDKDAIEINEIYELSDFLLQNKIPCHQIVLNNNKEIITVINNLPYILLKIFVKNRNITVDDLMFFSTINIIGDQHKSLVKNNWYEMWTKKVDYFEYQISQFGKKYPIIRESINYYIGCAENAISLFDEIDGRTIYNLVVSHKRIKNNDGIIEFYNPLNFILDSKVRDLSEYIKEKFFFDSYSVEEAKIDIYKLGLTNEQYRLLFARLLFPTYYFDCYEEVIFENKSEKELLKIINKNSKYLEFLRYIYTYLRQFVSLPKMEWLLKK